MNAGTVTNAERQAAEVSANHQSAPAGAARSTNAPRATITSGRTHAPLTGRVRGSGVPHSSGAPAETAVLCNITEQTWILQRTHGTFVVAGRSASANGGSTGRENSEVDAPGGAGSISERESEIAAPYALTRISARTGAIDLGDKRTLEFPISARDIAEDLAREINSDGGEASYFGVFVCEGETPEAHELAEARELLSAFYTSLVSAADKQWERTHNVAFISDLERRAARELRLEKDWSYEPTMRNECPACGERLKPNVAVCRVCGAVLNREKAAQFGLVPAEVAPSVNSVVAEASHRSAETNRATDAARK
jgi:hypothetical protein